MESATGWKPLNVPRGADRRRSDLRRTRQQEAFLRLAVTHALVMAGDAMVTVALAGSIFFSTDVNGARGRVALSLVLTMAPFAVVAPFLGPAIDRSAGGRRLMMILSAGGRALVCLYMARYVDDLLLFLPGALVLLILSKAHAVAKSSLVPAAVDSTADLVRAGGRLAMLAAGTGFVAAGPAAGILKIFGAAWVLRVAAAVYAAGTVSALRCRPAPPALPLPPDHVDELVRSRGVALAAVSMTVLRAIVGFLTFAVAFDFRRSHAPSWWYGIVIGGSLLGAFVGNVVGPRLRQAVAEEYMLTLSLGAVGAAGFFAWYVGSRLAIALLALIVGLGAGTGRLAFDAIVQRDGSEGARGRSFARYEATFQLAWVAAALVPVAVPGHGVPKQIAALIVGLVAFGAASHYVAGRRVVERLRGRRRRRVAATRPAAAEPADVTAADPHSSASPGPFRGGAAGPPDDEDVWSFVRPEPAAPEAPPVGAGPEASPAGAGPEAPPVGAGPEAPAGPRRNPRRSLGPKP